MADALTIRYDESEHVLRSTGESPGIVMFSADMDEGEASFSISPSWQPTGLGGPTLTRTTKPIEERDDVLVDVASLVEAAADEEACQAILRMAVGSLAQAVEYCGPRGPVGVRLIRAHVELLDEVYSALIARAEEFGE